MSVTRLPNWPSLLSAFLDARRSARFEYGKHDCCLFVADALQSITGVDFAAEFRNQYHSRFGALRRMREKCVNAAVDGLAGRVFASQGLEPVLPAYAQRGDVLALLQGGETVLGIVGLDGWPLIADDPGWAIANRHKRHRAWKV